MAKSSRHQSKLVIAALSALYVSAIAFVTVTFLGWKLPVYGYAWLPQFGTTRVEQMSQEFREEANFLTTSATGYDGQYYAQLAIDPLIRNPETVNAFDNFQFRARRPLFPALAYLAGFGEPNATLQAYCQLNLFFWLTTALLLLRWLPPNSWQNAIRYLSSLFAIGLIYSLSRSLLDGPALFLVSLGILFLELNRPWLSATTLALAGLGKETSVFAASAFEVPTIREPYRLLQLGLKLALVATPLALWIVYIGNVAAQAGAGTFGTDNFDLPFSAWWKAWADLIQRAKDGQPAAYTFLTVATLTAMPIQAIGLLATRQFKNPWWRVGAIYAVFSMLLGYATWEGTVGSVTRICLPMTIAFNIVLPRNAKWLVVLVLGNLLSVAGFFALKSYTPPVVHHQAPPEASFSEKISLDWKTGWIGMERDENNYWNWATGESEISLDNPTQSARTASFRFQTRALHPTKVSVTLNGEYLTSFDADLPFGDQINIELRLSPGSNELRFSPDYRIKSGDRPLNFVLLNPTLEEL